MNDWPEERLTIEEFAQALKAVFADGRMRTARASVWSYQTHTGDPMKEPWAGPIAHEVYVKLSLSEQAPWSQVEEVITAIRAAGFEPYLRHDDDEGGNIGIGIRRVLTSK